MGSRLKITKRAVDALTNRADDGDAIIWDEEIRGFGVRCRASGSKHYFLKIRTGGRQRWLTIGRHGSPWTAESARKEALRLLGEKVQGIDPAAVRDRPKATLTVGEAGEEFFEEHAARTKPSTLSEYKRQWETVIEPRMGTMRVTDVQRADVARLHYQLRESPYMANRTVATLSKFFNWAGLRGLQPEGGNPTHGIEKFKEKKRERFLSSEELARLGTALTDCVNEDVIGPNEAGAIRLLLLTGCRLNEILSLQWSHVNFEKACLQLPDSKTGAKTVQLNAPALEVLISLPRLATNPHVIVGRRKGRHLVNLSKPWREVCRKAKLDGLRLHDLRHSYASMGAGVGLGLPVIGALLGHTQAATTQRYAHLAADPLKQAADVIGARLSEALDGESNKTKGRTVAG